MTIIDVIKLLIVMLPFVISMLGGLISGNLADPFSFVLGGISYLFLLLPFFLYYSLMQKKNCTAPLSIGIPLFLFYLAVLVAVWKASETSSLAGVWLFLILPLEFIWVLAGYFIDESFHTSKRKK